MSKEANRINTPRLALVTSAHGTRVFFEGRDISYGIEDLTYHAKNEKGELAPTLEVKINVTDFSLGSEGDFERFMEGSARLRTSLGQNQAKQDSAREVSSLEHQN